MKSLLTIIAIVFLIVLAIFFVPRGITQTATERPLHTQNVEPPVQPLTCNSGTAVYDLRECPEYRPQRERRPKPMVATFSSAYSLIAFLDCPVGWTVDQSPMDINQPTTQRGWKRLIPTLTCRRETRLERNDRNTYATAGFFEHQCYIFKSWPKKADKR